MKIEGISIAIPYHGDRVEWTLQTISACHSYAYIREIVITVDPSTVQEVNKLYRAVKNFKKVRIILNEERLFVFRNKIKAVESCTSDWVALIDSDNVAGALYFGPIIRSAPLSENVIYSPEVGFHSLHYEEFNEKDIALNDAVDLIGNKSYDMLINTMNYFFHRKTWLKALESAIASDYEPVSADSAWINYNCLKAGMVLRVVKGCSYKHTVHHGSTYLQNQHEGVTQYANICKIMKGEYKDVKDFTSAREIHARKSHGISSTSNISATGRPSGDLVQEECKSNLNGNDILSD